MTAAEYANTEEHAEHRYELQEGAIVMAARPMPDHQDVLLEFAFLLRSQVPDHLKLLLEVDVDLGLAPPRGAGTVRAPDLVVVTRESFLRVRGERGLLRADDAVLAVEIHSSTTRRTDTVIKRGEYADAGIGHYWMIDLLGGPSITACHLAGEFGYQDAGPVRGRFETAVPFPARLDLDALS